MAMNKLNSPDGDKGNTMRNERRSTDDYLQEVYDSLVAVWDKNKFDMSKGYDDEYECECIKITYKDNDGVYAKIYVDDYEGKHPVAFDVVYRYPGDKGVGIKGTYEFQSTDFDETAPEIFDYFDEVAKKASESLEPHIDLDKRGDAELCEDDPIKLRRDINSRGYFVDDKGFYNVYVGASFKGKFASVEDAAEVGYTLVESKKCEATDEQVSRAQALLDSMDPDQSFSYYDEYGDYIKGVPHRTILFEAPTEGGKLLTFGVEFIDNTLSSIYVCDEDGEWFDEGTDFEDIKKDPEGWYNAVMRKVPEDKKTEGLGTNIKNAQPKVYLVSEVAEKDLYDSYDDILDVLEGTQSFVSVETAEGHEELPLGYDRDKNVLLIYDDDALTDDVVDTAKMLVMNFITGQSAVSEKPLTDDYVCIVDGMYYTTTYYVPESKKSEDTKVGKFTIMPKDTSRKQAGIRAYQTRLGEMGFKSNLHNNGDYIHDYVKEIGKIPGATVYVGTIDNFQKNTQEYQYEAELYMENEKGIRSNIEYMPFAITDISDGMQRKMYFNRLNALIKKGTDFVNNYESSESCKKSESLTLKQKELKDMVRYGEAEDITTISNEEAKELRKKGVETVGISRGTYGMNGALLRDKDGNKYVITARSSNLFYFV